MTNFRPQLEELERRDSPAQDIVTASGQYFANNNNLSNMQATRSGDFSWYSQMNVQANVLQNTGQLTLTGATQVGNALTSMRSQISTTIQLAAQASVQNDIATALINRYVNTDGDRSTVLAALNAAIQQETATLQLLNNSIMAEQNYASDAMCILECYGN